MNKTMADELNEHLARGGVVVISSYLKATQYDPKHTGMFFMRGINLYVKHGNRSVCLSAVGIPNVSIKLYSYKRGTSKDENSNNTLYV
jgi:hypothetical protein